MTVSIQRKLLLPFRLPSGGIVPAGNLIAVPQQAILMDENLYSTPDQFNPQRYFSSQHCGKSHDFTAKFTDVSIVYPFWGSSKKPCPGRCYVSDTLKLALIHLINEYDFKLEKEDTSRSFFWTTAMVPRLNTMICMKARSRN